MGGGITEFLSERVKKRLEFNIPVDAFVIVSVGELNENKNNKTIIKAMSKLLDYKIHYVLCGIGDKEADLRELAYFLNLHKNVHLIGYRTDINEILMMSDVFVMPSYREGLSRSIMEAMACGLPCIVSNIRGNKDLIEDGVGGYLNNPTDFVGFSENIKSIINDRMLRHRMSVYNLSKIKNFDINKVVEILTSTYKEVLEYEKRSSNN